MTRKGVWDIQDVRDKYLQSAWASDGLLFAWGYNAGALGVNDAAARSSPIQIPGTKWSASSIMDKTASSVRDDGTLWIWGYNDNGALGLNQPDNNRYSSPIQIPGTTWSRVSLTTERGMASKSDGTLWVWGDNGAGKLGQNNETKYSSPVQIPGTTWSDEFATGHSHTLAIKTDGTLWAWGNNGDGRLGQGNETQYSSPKQIPGTTWSKVAAAQKNSMAVKTDGTLWSWGEGVDGSLGHNNNSKYSSPRQIPGTTWIEPGCGYNWSGCVKTDGTLWTWGNNSVGNLGLNNRTNYSSPKQVSGTTWAYLYGGQGNPSSDSAAMATKTDGTLWTWGNQEDGTLGLGDLVKCSSPTQVGSDTTWKVHRHASGVSKRGMIAIKGTLTPSQM
jgi:hypothetical protein